MFKLSLLHFGDKLYDHGNGEYTDYGYYSTVPKVKYMSKAGFIFKDPSSDMSAEIPGKIFTGPPDRFGDKDCLHYGLDGSATYSDNIQKETPDHRWTYVNPCVWFQIKAYSCILDIGQSHLDGPWMIYNKSSRTPVYRGCFFRAEENYIMFYQAQSSTPNGKVTGTLYTVRVDRKTRKSSSITQTGIECTNWASVLSLTYQGPPAIPGKVMTFQGSFTDSSVTLDEAVRKIKNYINLAKPYMSVVPNLSLKQGFGYAAQDAVNSVRYVDTNGLQFLLELTTMRSMLSGIFPSSLDPKALSKAYLASKFGLDSSLRDFDSYLRGMVRRLKSSRKSYRATHGTHIAEIGDSGYVEYHYKIFYKFYDNQLLRVYNFLDQWALYPNLEMAWDFIPFSFLVDWFVDVGSILESIDTRTRAESYDVLSVTRSEKIVRTDVLTDPLFPLPVSGDVSFFYYHREAGRKQLDLPDLAFDPPTEFKNILELTTLIVSHR